ncbi:hypothetical protein WMW72_18780 [Paenibacillus filicis]|uniref:Arginyl tRNA synthetase N-terminal domain-containing protein n=1 Tax=Paenibacillus filicis TaxID=669464 RepID=A0ABU9DM63_9BACL
MMQLEMVALVTAAVRELLAESGKTETALERIAFERPAKLEHGEYSLNIAMALAKTLQRSPLAIAAELKDKLERQEAIRSRFAKVEIAAPGYLNFYVRWEAWLSRWAEAFVPAFPAKGLKAVIEHTSINPNKSAHIGHLRNSCIGDTLSRLLRRT